MVRQVAKYLHGVPSDMLDWIAIEKITRTLQLLQSTVQLLERQTINRDSLLLYSFSVCVANLQ